MMEKTSIHMPKLSFIALAAVIAVFTLSLSSCDGMRKSLFGFQDDQETPELHFYPEPGSAAYTQPLRVNIGLPTRFRDWTIVYTYDPDITLDEPEKWTEYNPEKGLLLGTTVDLRAIAYLEGTVEVSAVAAARYVFNIPNIQVYVDPNGPVDGTGIDPGMPFNTLQAGIDLAASIYSGAAPVIVCARSGSYNESVVMRSGVILRGSYDWSWNPPSDTVTDPETFFPSSYLNGKTNNEGPVTPLESAIPCHTLRFPAGMSAPSAVEYFQINRPPQAANTAAVLIESEQTTIYRCRLEGGGGNGASAGIKGSTAALWLRQGGVIVDTSNLVGRSDTGSPGDSFGIINFDSILDLRHSVVRSGYGMYDGLNLMDTAGIFARDSTLAGTPSVSVTGQSIVEAYLAGYPTLNNHEYSVGIDVENCQSLIENNMRIEAGAVNNSTGTGALSCAIRVFGGTATIRANNSILARDTSPLTSGYETIGVLVSGGANALIENNHLIESTNSTYHSAGVLATASVGAMTIRNNNIAAGGGVESVGVDLRSINSFLSVPIIERNRIFGGTAVGSYGLRLLAIPSPSVPIVIRNNIIHGGAAGVNGPRGVAIQNVSNTGLSVIHLLSNTIWSGTSSTGSRFGLTISGSDYVDITNNIIDSGGYALLTNSPINHLSLLNNCLYTTGGGDPCYNGSISIPFSNLNNAGIMGFAVCSENIAVATNPRNAYDGVSAYPGDFTSFLSFGYGMNNASAESTSLESGGVNLSALAAPIGFAIDWAGDARTDPWTIGACEN
jgi:hypothetical protein